MLIIASTKRYNLYTRHSYHLIGGFTQGLEGLLPELKGLYPGENQIFGEVVEWAVKWIWPFELIIKVRLCSTFYLISNQMILEIHFRKGGWEVRICEQKAKNVFRECHPKNIAVSFFSYLRWRRKLEAIQHLQNLYLYHIVRFHSL